MDNDNLIFEHLSTFIVPQTNKVIKEEYIAYKYTTNFVDKFQNVIVEHILEQINIFVSMIRLYCNENSINFDEFIVEKLTASPDSKNTGAIPKKLSSINEILNYSGKNGETRPNIRELFFIIDEIIHNCCKIVSWITYVKFCSDTLDLQLKNQLSIENINLKLIFMAELITGAKQEWFNNIDILKKFIKTTLGTKYSEYDGKEQSIKNKYAWEASGYPTMCHGWAMPERTYDTHKLLFYMEYQRKSKEPGPYSWWDTRDFTPPCLCNDICRQNKKYFAYNISKPPLSEREIDHIRSNNPNFNNDQTIPWLGGCCYYYASKNTTTYRVSELYNKPRATSYSGHTSMDLEFFSYFKSFEMWKEVYILCIMATMIPYCHHTAHEIFVTATHWGIEYDLRESYSYNFKKIVDVIKSKNVLSNFDVGVEYGILDSLAKKSEFIDKEIIGGNLQEINYYDKYVKYKRKYINKKNH